MNWTKGEGSFGFQIPVARVIQEINDTAYSPANLWN